MAGPGRCTQPGGAAANCIVEELEAVGDEFRAGSTCEPVPDGVLRGVDWGNFQLSQRAIKPAVALALRFTDVSADLLGVDVRVCRECDLAGNDVGKPAGVLYALLILPVEMARAWVFGVATTHLSRSGAVGRLAWATESASRPWICTFSDGNRNARALNEYQGRMDVRLLAVVAGVLSRSDSATQAGINN